MKLLIANVAANSLTCDLREADANLPNLYPQSQPPLPANRLNPVPIETRFLPFCLATEYQGLLLASEND
jgi:hypothetical protein